MTEEEKKAYMYVFINQLKTYCHIDYDDDDDVIQTITEAVFEKLGELIPDFNPYAMTGRQRLIAMMFAKEQYDNRAAYQTADSRLTNAASSMLLSEIYKGGGS